MKRIPVILLIAGLTMLGAQRYFDFQPETLPLPGNGLTVHMSIVVRSGGEYYLVVSMPKADNAFGLTSETIACSFTISATSPGYEPIKENVVSLERHSEIGFSNIQLYQSQPWHLNAREYKISIHSDSPCEAANSRGAAVSLERQAFHDTERYLGYLLIFYLGVLFVGAGLVGIIAREFRKV